MRKSLLPEEKENINIFKTIFVLFGICVLIVLFLPMFMLAGIVCAVILGIMFGFSIVRIAIKDMYNIGFLPAILSKFKKT